LHARSAPFLPRNRVDYALGGATTTTLRRHINTLKNTVARLAAAGAPDKLQRFKEFYDGAASWDRVEHPIVRCGHPDRAFAPGQQVLDPFPLVVAQSEPPHHRSASNKLTAYESKKPPRRNRGCNTRRRFTADCGNTT
jgi:hypothetical protein